MRVLSLQGDLVDSYNPALKEHRCAVYFLVFNRHCCMYRAVKRALERQAARVPGQGKADLPPIKEWRRFDAWTRSRNCFSARPAQGAAPAYGRQQEPQDGHWQPCTAGPRVRGTLKYRSHTRRTLAPSWRCRGAFSCGAACDCSSSTSRDAHSGLSLKALGSMSLAKQLEALFSGPLCAGAEAHLRPGVSVLRAPGADRLTRCATCFFVR